LFFLQPASQNIKCGYFDCLYNSEFHQAVPSNHLLEALIFE